MMEISELKIMDVPAILKEPLDEPKRSDYITISDFVKAEEKSRERKFLQVLFEIGPCAFPLELASVKKYQTKPFLKIIEFVLLISILIVGNVTIIGVITGIVIGIINNQWSIFRISLSGGFFTTLLLFLLFGLINPSAFQWKRIPLDEYKDYIPESASDTVSAIKEKLPYVKFYVEYLTLGKKMQGSFFLLMIIDHAPYYLGIAPYYLGAWSNPNCKIIRGWYPQQSFE